MMMLEDTYKLFNAGHFSPEKYARIGADIRREAGDPAMRMCETPVFISQDYAGQMVQASREIVAQTLRLDLPVPPAFDLATVPKRPTFFIVDFAVTKDGPRLIELQGFASNLLFMPIAAEIYRSNYGLSDKYKSLFCDIEQIRKAVMGHHAAENVVLMEINPWQQPSRRDFIVTQRLFGIPVIDVLDVIKKGRELYYMNAEGKETRIRRIYNRVVPGEYQSLGLGEKTSFHFNDDLDVEWAGHPSWFMRVSKYVLPYLQHPLVPNAWFLDQMSSYPMDLENYVLKPAFLNAGIGVKINVTEADINAVDIIKRNQYILMEKVHYEPFIPDLEGNRMCAELRVMFVWPDDGELQHTGFSARVMKGNDVNANIWGKDPWCGLAPVFVV